MSYILDALRKADAERERDPARGIHAQPLAQLPAASRRLPPALWVALAAVLVVAGAAAYVLRERSAPAPLPAPVAVAPAPAAVAPAPVAAPVPAAPPVATPVADSVQPAPPPMPAPQPVKVAAVKTAPVAKVAKTADAAKPADANKGAATTQVAAASPSASAAPADAAAAKPLDAAKTSPAATAERIYAQAELPADVQHALPKLAISGGVYSENAAQRMLVVGGQVVGEGAELAPGVLLEQIRSRSAVLRFKGWRYSVGF